MEDHEPNLSLTSAAKHYKQTLRIDWNKMSIFLTKRFDIAQALLNNNDVKSKPFAEQSIATVFPPGVEDQFLRYSMELKKRAKRCFDAYRHAMSEPEETGEDEDEDEDEDCRQRETKRMRVQRTAEDARRTRAQVDENTSATPVFILFATLSDQEKAIAQLKEGAAAQCRAISDLRDKCDELRQQLEERRDRSASVTGV